ncbi:MAG: hypothetical protein ACE5GX_01475 [Thermoanaerobaculia bacterium]
MSDSQGSPWFPAKKLGWGWGLPIAWQGWLAFTVYLGLVGAGVVLPVRGAGMLLFLLYNLVLGAAFLEICWLKGGEPTGQLAEEAGFVALRLVALWLLLTGLLGFLTSLSWLGYTNATNPESRFVGISQVLGQLAIMAVAGLVFINTRKVSRVLFSSADDLEVSSSARSIQVVAISVIGIVLIAGSLPGLAIHLVKLFWVLRAGAMAEREAFFSSETFFSVLYESVSLAIGAFLFFRSTWLANRWAGPQEPRLKPDHD